LSLLDDVGAPVLPGAAICLEECLVVLSRFTGAVNVFDLSGTFIRAIQGVFGALALCSARKADIFYVAFTDRIEAYHAQQQPRGPLLRWTVETVGSSVGLLPFASITVDLQDSVYFAAYAPLQKALQQGSSAALAAVLSVGVLVQVLDRNGRLSRAFRAEVPCVSACSLAIHPTKQVVYLSGGELAKAGQVCTVHAFDTAGSRLPEKTVFGRKNSVESCISGIAFDLLGAMYVSVRDALPRDASAERKAEASSCRIEAYTAATNARADYILGVRPCHVSVDDRNRLLLSDADANTVHIMHNLADGTALPINAR